MFRLDNRDRWKRDWTGGGETLEAGADLQGDQWRPDPGLHHLAEGEQGIFLLPTSYFLQCTVHCSAAQLVHSSQHQRINKLTEPSHIFPPVNNRP